MPSLKDPQQRIQQRIDDLRREIDKVRSFERRVALENDLDQLVELLETYVKEDLK